MGAFSRSKGARGERELVLYLALRGWTAERNLRQYQVKGEYDVQAVKDDKVITFENKFEKCSYKTIYDLYYVERNPMTGLLCFTMDFLTTTVSMSTDFEDLLKMNDRRYRVLCSEVLAPKAKSAFERILRLKLIKGKADYLVIKDNGKPRLFIHYG